MRTPIFMGVLATSACEQPLATAGSTVTEMSTAVASISVSPGFVSAATAQVVQLTATPRDAKGAPLSGRVVRWSSSNTAAATVTATGLVTVVPSGSATITATSEGKSGTAAVAAAVSSAGLWPHEPAGFMKFLDTDFSGFPVDGWSVADNASNVSVVTDLTAPMSPTKRVIQWKYAQGFPAGISPGTVYNDVLTQQVSEYFVGFNFKFSSPYNNELVGTKMWYPASPADYFVMYMNNGTIQFGVQVPAAQGGTYWLAGNVSNPIISLGGWHRFEHYFKPASSPTARDGIIRWWIDGVLCGDHADVMWPSGHTWEEWKFSPTWGGGYGTGEVVAFDSYFSVDRSYLSRP